MTEVRFVTAARQALANLTDEEFRAVRGRVNREMRAFVASPEWTGKADPLDRYERFRRYAGR